MLNVLFHLVGEPPDFKIIRLIEEELQVLSF